MIRRTMLWRVVAALFTVVNLVGAGYAMARLEGPHAGVHVVLSLLGAYALWRLAPIAEWRGLPPELPVDDRLGHLQLSVDAVAIEVERIGEAQRFSTKLQAERAEPRH
ncbi:hypothetical protein BH11GEM1_BH11GEM1_18930 [soil metagenome]